MKILDYLSAKDTWKEVEFKALKAAVDFKTIIKSINATVSKLKNYRLFVDANKTPENEATTFGAFSKVYSQKLESVKNEILKTLQGLGHNYSSFDQYLSEASNVNEHNTRLNYAKLTAWNKLKGRFFELLCLVSNLSDALSTDTVKTVGEVFNQLGPIDIIHEGVECNIWTQQTFTDTISGLNARPDIIKTSPASRVTKGNVIEIIECKCVKNLNINTIRAEFGKAHDLGVVSSYNIVSYYEPDKKIVSGAKELGITVIPFRLNTKERKFFVNNPEKLAESLADDFKRSRKERHFFNYLEKTAEAAKMKLSHFK